MLSLAERPRRGELAIAAGLAAWIAAWIWIGRYALLDDALIHLRFAHLLRQAGFLTFDGITPSFGASSPLFVGLLAALSWLDGSPLLAKEISVVFYLALLAVVARSAWRHERERPLWILLAVVLAGPMALRWLTDGMETSLAAVLAAALAMTLAPGDREEVRAGFEIWAPFALGAIAVLARVELSLAIFFGVAAAVPATPLRRLAHRHLPAALGGLAGLELLAVLFGHVVPDTALAKRTAPVSYAEAWLQVGRSTAASFTLGIGLVALWLATLAIAWRRAGRPERASLAIANLLLPAVVAAIAVRGQILHGVRYLLWAYLFSTVWNLQSLARSRPPDGPRRAALAPRLPRSLAAAAAIALLAAWAYEGAVVARILDQRGRMLLAMRGEHLERLAGATGAGFDIGFAAFFTRARILDFNGLVNGRRIAELTTGERIRHFAAARPGFLFVDEEQARSLAPFLALADYRICFRYPLSSLANRQVYFLAVRSPAAGLFGARCATPLDAAIPAAPRRES